MYFLTHTQTNAQADLAPLGLQLAQWGVDLRAAAAESNRGGGEVVRKQSQNDKLQEAAVEYRSKEEQVSSLHTP